MSTGIILNTELNSLRSIKLDELSDADRGSLRTKWEANRSIVQAIFERTKANIEIYTRALNDGEKLFKDTTKLIPPSPELQREYDIERTKNTRHKADLEANLAPQQALIGRIDKFLSVLPVTTVESRCEKATSFIKKIAPQLFSAVVLAAAGFALKAYT